MEGVVKDAWRSPPDAWDSIKFNLSAGWVSNVDMFQNKVSENIGHHVLAELQQIAKSGDNLGVIPLGGRHELVMNNSLNRR